MILFDQLRLMAIYDVQFIQDESAHMDASIAAIKQAIAGGATIIQYRDKKNRDETFIVQASKLQPTAAAYHIPFIINDRYWLVEAIGADGLHIGQSDGDPRHIRACLGYQMILGFSITNLEQIRAIPPGAVDYCGVGPIFSTSSKNDCDPVLGIADTHHICRKLPYPVIGIGGIGMENIAQVMQAGCQGAAMISAIYGAADIKVATRKLRQLIDQNLTQALA